MTSSFLEDWWAWWETQAQWETVDAAERLWDSPKAERFLQHHREEILESFPQIHTLFMGNKFNEFMQTQAEAGIVLHALTKADAIKDFPAVLFGVEAILHGNGSHLGRIRERSHRVRTGDEISPIGGRW